MAKKEIVKEATPQVLTHAELAKSGPTRVTVLKEGASWVGTGDNRLTCPLLEVKGQKRMYRVENEQTCTFWNSTSGRTFTVMAEGEKEKATLTYVGEPGTQVLPPLPKDMDTVIKTHIRDALCEFFKGGLAALDKDWSAGRQQVPRPTEAKAAEPKSAPEKKAGAAPVEPEKEEREVFM